MTVTVIANGHTYTDDANPTTGMAEGGFRERLLPMLSDVMVETNLDRSYVDGKLVEANTAAATATTAAASAIGSPNTNGTSTTSLTISNAVKSLTATTGKTWVVGMWITLASGTTPSTAWMNGAITAYNSSTGALTVDVKRCRGSGSNANWVISASAPGVPDAGGSTITTGSAVLGVNSTRYQVILPATSGVAVLTADPTTGTEGPNAVVIENRVVNDAYGFDVQVTNSIGAGIGYVPPGRDASVNNSSNGVVMGRGALPYGSLLLANVTFASAVAGTSGLYTKALLLPSGDTLLLVHGASLHAVVYSASGGALGTPVQLRTGLVAAGDDFSVSACHVNDGSDNVIVTSINGTALQSVMLTISGGSITANTALATTLGTAWTRIVDVKPAGTASNRFMLLGLTSATNAQVIGLELSGTTLVASAATGITIVSSIAALLPRDSDNVITVLVAASATTVTARPYTVGASGALTLGTIGTLTTTAATYLAVRYDFTNSLWTVMHVNTTARVAALTVSAAPAATFSTATVFQSAVSTLTAAYCGGDWDATSDTLTVVATGTGSTGRPVAELWRISCSTGVPVSTGSALVTYMDAVPTATYLNGTGQWQLVAGSEMVMLLPFNTSGVMTDWRMPGAATYAQMATPLDNTDIKAIRPRNLLRSTSRALTVLDGTKPSMQYGEGWAEITRTPVRLINSALNSRTLTSKNQSGVTQQMWVAAGPNPATTLTIQCLALV